VLDLGDTPPERLGTWTRTNIGTPQHFVWLELIVKAILVLNAVDAVLTLLWVHTGRATEANPLLAELVDSHPVLFVSVKLTLVALGSSLLWHFRRRRLAVIGIFAGFLIYYYLLLYHLGGFDLRLIRRALGH
jgi:hypothetical protein